VTHYLRVKRVNCHNTWDFAHSARLCFFVVCLAQHSEIRQNTIQMENEGSAVINWKTPVITVEPLVAPTQIFLSRALLLSLCCVSLSVSVHLSLRCVGMTKGETTYILTDSVQKTLFN